MLLQRFRRFLSRMFRKQPFLELKEFQVTPLEKFFNNTSEVSFYLSHLDDIYFPTASTSLNPESSSSALPPALDPWDMVVERIIHLKDVGPEFLNAQHEYLSVELFCRRDGKQLKGVVLIDRNKSPDNVEKKRKHKRASKSATTTKKGSKKKKATVLQSSHKENIASASLVVSDSETVPLASRSSDPLPSSPSAPQRMASMVAADRAEYDHHSAPAPKRSIKAIFASSSSSVPPTSAGILAPSVVSSQDSLNRNNMVAPDNAEDSIRWEYSLPPNSVVIQSLKFHERSLEQEGAYQYKESEWQRLKQEAKTQEKKYREPNQYKYGRMNFHQLVTLASFLHNQQSKYTISTGQCFWFADSLIRLAADRSGAEIEKGVGYDQRGKFRFAGVYKPDDWIKQYNDIHARSYNHVSAGRADYDARNERRLREESDRKAEEERRLKEEEQRKREESDRKVLEEQRKREESDRKALQERRLKEESDRRAREERFKREESDRKREETQKRLEEAEKRIAELEHRKGQPKALVAVRVS